MRLSVSLAAFASVATLGAAASATASKKRRSCSSTGVLVGVRYGYASWAFQRSRVSWCCSLRLTSPEPCVTRVLVVPLPPRTSQPAACSLVQVPRVLRVFDCAVVVAPHQLLQCGLGGRLRLIPWPPSVATVSPFDALTRNAHFLSLRWYSSPLPAIETPPVRIPLRYVLASLPSQGAVPHRARRDGARSRWRWLRPGFSRPLVARKETWSLASYTVVHAIALGSREQQRRGASARPAFRSFGSGLARISHMRGRARGGLTQ